MRARRVAGLGLVLGILVWAWSRALPPGAVVNSGGLALLGDLLARAFNPSLDPAFLAVVFHASVITVTFAALGTAGALVLGIVGGLVLSDAAWDRMPPLPVRALRLALRAVLVAVRSIHELVWALLFVSVLGLDPLVAVLAIAVPFGAQTAKVFAETLDAVPSGPLSNLRNAGARRLPALAYGLFPGATPLLLSYSFYRFECAIRSAVLLGVVGVGGLGQELVVSLQSRDWREVWTLVGAVLLLSAVVDLWSSRVRAEMARAGSLPVRPESDSGDESATEEGGLAARRMVRAGRSRWARRSVVVVLVGLVAAWQGSGVSLSGLTAARTGLLTGRLLDDLWPPAWPPGGAGIVVGATLDTLAMALLAIAFAVVLTLVLGPLAARPESRGQDTPPVSLPRVTRVAAWWFARAALLVLRSVPPNIWAVFALLALFPGVLPGALALGLYTGGILGRLVAEAWESIDTRPRNALVAAGVSRRMSSLAATIPPSTHHLVTYTLYRFEICVRDTAVVGVVGAAGLGLLLAENLSVFRFSVVSTLLIASFAVSAATELVGRRVRRLMRT
ncbi:MAG: ABC transporter permease subunit [Actinomycetota bacterium]|nr:ABC transporter permease subunit [Actinomycetota bacterium]